MKKAVVIISGGMDSSTLLYQVNRDFDEVFALSFDYGQRHKKELGYAAKTCTYIGVPHKIVDLSNINELLQGSSLTTPGMDVPEGHYAEPSMKQTVVPNRNMIMLSLALGYAISIGAKDVFYGAHAGDHAIYPDCRPVFVHAMQTAANVCHFEPVELHCPFQNMDKGDIAILGQELGVRYDLTWTCYKGGEKACGKCGACRERLEAFEKAGMDDPVPYE